MAALARPEAEVGVMAADQTNDQAFDIASCEGIGYAVNGYCSGDGFADPETRRLWNAAGEALKALEEHLERVTGRRFEDE